MHHESISDTDLGSQIAKDHSSTLGSMHKSLTEAHREHCLLGTERQYLIEARLVKCMVQLSQDLGGLRSAASTQFSVLAKASSQATASQNMPMIHSSGASSSRGRKGSISRSSMLDVIEEDPEDMTTSDYHSQLSSGDGARTPPCPQPGVAFQSVDYSGRPGRTSSRSVLKPADMFVTFINQLGPPAKSLAYTLKQILDELQFAEDGVIDVHEQFASSLEQAISLYKQSRKEALEFLYQSRTLKSSRSTETLADLEEVAASCGHFSFSLLDFAEGVRNYLGLLEDLKIEMEQSPRRRSWRWLLFWRPRSEEEVEADPLGNVSQSI